MDYRTPEFTLFLAVSVFLLFIIYRLSKKAQKAESEVATLRAKELELTHQKEQLASEAQKMESDAIKARYELSQHKRNLAKLLQSNLTSMPWLAGMMADFLTYDLEIEAKKLDWGRDVRRLKKVASIRDLRNQTKQKIAEAKEAIYQLEYLRTLFPGIDDVLVSDYKDLELNGKPLTDHDPALDYLSKEEWLKLSEIERNQLALDRYIASRKSNASYPPPILLA